MCHSRNTLCDEHRLVGPTDCRLQSPLYWRHLGGTGALHYVTYASPAEYLSYLSSTLAKGFGTTRRWHVSKGILVSGLDALLGSGKLRFAAELTEASALRDELATFQRSVSAAGRAQYSARVGKHDDLVLAVALCVWCARGGSGHNEVYHGTVASMH